MYLLQVLQPPKVVLQSLERLCNAFLWDHSVESCRIHWASWDKQCLPVEEGGLAFRRFEDMVDAFSANLWRKLQLKNWVNFMHSKYIKGQHPFIAQVTCLSLV